MNIILFQQCIRRKPTSPAIKFHPLPKHCLSTSISSHEWTQASKTSCKRLDKALRVLDLISPRKSLTLTRQSHLRLIQDFLQSDSCEVSKQEFSDNNVVGAGNVLDQVASEKGANLREDPTLLSNALSSCASLRDLRYGIQLHSMAFCNGFLSNVYVGSSLVSLYTKCGEVENGYKVFEAMPVRNVVSWTAMISGFAHEWRIDMCLSLYKRMKISASMPNDYTFTSLLSACTGSGSLGQGRSVHGQTIQTGFDSYVHIANALISMYGKCGNIKEASFVFEDMDNKDTVSWNSLITGYALHGLEEQSIGIFEEMQKQNVKPDAVTFLGILSCCRHAGLVEKGRSYFDIMHNYGIQPELDHYSCIIDLLGRAGLLKEALDFIKKMPMTPNSIIWGSLLSSCRLHGGVWIGIQAAEGRLLTEPACPATHVQLANLYASEGYWQQAARVRKLMKAKGLKTNPGYSWIEIKNEVYRFRAEDKSNTRLSEILSIVDCLVDQMRSLGCVPEIHEELDDDLEIKS